MTPVCRGRFFYPVREQAKPDTGVIGTIDWLGTDDLSIQNQEKQHGINQ